MKVVWYRSLRVKIFALVALVVTVSTGLVAWQNLGFFTGVLHRQTEENLISSAQKTANSLHSSLLFWSATIHATMRMGEQGGVGLASAAASMVAANRDVVAFQVLRISEGKVQSELVRFTSNRSPDFRTASPEMLFRSIGETGRKFALDAEKSGIKSGGIANLVGSVSVPLLQLRIRFTESSKGNDAVWALLSFWPASIAPLLHRGDHAEMVLVDTAGTLILDGEGEAKGKLFSAVDIERVASLGKGRLSFRSWNTVLKSGDPLFTVMQLLPDFRLVVLSQKILSAEQRQVGQQIRNLLLAAWILLLISLFASFLAANRMASRIGNLVDLVVAIAKGDFSARVPVESQDELGELALSVNKMSTDIQELMKVRENAVRQEEELRTAETFQRAFFPKQRVDDERIRTHSFFRPATECAGDWWGQFSLGNGRHLVVIADAAGHGASSALLASVAFSYFATLQQNSLLSERDDFSPVQMLEQINRILWNAGEGAMTMTMIVMLFDIDNRFLKVARAGHVPFFRVFADDSAVDERAPLAIKAHQPKGDLLGFHPSIEVVEETHALKGGERFVLHTDGLFECENGHGVMLQKRHFRDFLISKAPVAVNGFMQSVSDFIREFFGGAALTDDVTLVLVELDRNLNREPV